MQEVIGRFRAWREVPALIVGGLLAALFLVNRGVSQIAFGPVFLLDVTLMAAVFLRPLAVVRTSLRFWPAFALVGASIVWLVIEAFGGTVDALVARRAAAGIYAFVPIVLWVYRRTVFGWILGFPALAATFVVAGVAFVPGAASSVGAQVVAGLAVAVAANRRVRNRGLQFTWCLMAFAVLVGGVFTPESSLFRTPLASAALAAVVLWVAWWGRVLRTRRVRLTVGATIALAVGLSAVSLMVRPVQSGVGTVIAAAAGITGSEWLADVALELNPDRSRSRGDSIGTGRERVGFWRDIWNHNLASIDRMIVGSGHALSFFDAVRPGSVFLDQHLLEPHNSFFGILYRYGLVGVAALALLIATVVVHGRRWALTGDAWWVASLTVALVYANFEVALESPHGAVVFWALVILPFSAGDQRQPVRERCSAHTC